MRLGIFANTFAGGDPASVFAAVRAAGYPACQYNMSCSGLPSMPGAISEDTTRAVAAAARDVGIEIVSLSGTYNMIHPDPALRAKGHERLRVIAKAAQEMGTPLVTLCTGTRDAADQWRAHPGNTEPDAWRDLRESMDIALGFAEEHDVDLGVEPELANVIDSAVKARRLIDEVGSPRLKILLDPANLFETATPDQQRDIVWQAIDMLADRTVMGHAKDRTPSGQFTTAGKGILDYAHYVACLKHIDFKGTLVAHGLKASEAAEVAAFLRRHVVEAGL
jgi:sugar phosphate isomerase/epimerase